MLHLTGHEKEKRNTGRKPKMHKPINAPFDEVLAAFSNSEYQSKKDLKRKKK